MSIKSTARFGAPSHNLRCRPNLRGEGLVTIWGGLCPAPRPQREDGAVRQRQQSWLRHSVDSRARACVRVFTSATKAVLMKSGSGRTARSATMLMYSWPAYVRNETLTAAPSSVRRLVCHTDRRSARTRAAPSSGGNQNITSRTCPSSYTRQQVNITNRSFGTAATHAGFTQLH